MNGDDLAYTRSINRGKRLVVLIAALMVSAVVSGCSVSDACPTIGWANTVTVKLEGATSNVSVVEFCADGECSDPAPSQLSSDEPVRIETLDPQQLETFTPVPSAIQPPFFASKVDEHSWEISTIMATPENVTIRALSPSGEVLAERDVTLNWVRVGGTERCGGPAEADPITLTIAS